VSLSLLFYIGQEEEEIKERQTFQISNQI